MLITNHVLTGAVIGLAMPPRRRVSAATLGLASHFALDAVPHWGADGDKQLFLRVAVVDGLCGLATMAVIARVVPSSRRAAVMAGMLGSCLPDLDKPAQLFFGCSPFPARVDDFHARIQDESPDRLRKEITVAGRLVAAVALMAGAVRLARRDGQTARHARTITRGNAPLPS